MTTTPTRRLDTVLPTVPAADLPPLVYAHGTDHDPAVTATPAAFRPIVGAGWAKPSAGTGLWTAPVTSSTPDGLPADSAWLEWCRIETPTGDYTHLTEIIPDASARVLVVDTQNDLIRIVDAYPASYGLHLSCIDDRYPDWPALAANGWDALYLTDNGQWETRLPPHGPNLYTWDVATVFWLRPAYTVGRTTVVPASQGGAA